MVCRRRRRRRHLHSLVITATGRAAGSTTALRANHMSADHHHHHHSHYSLTIPVQTCSPSKSIPATFPVRFYFCLNVTGIIIALVLGWCFSSGFATKCRRSPRVVFALVELLDVGSRRVRRRWRWCDGAGRPISLVIVEGGPAIISQRVTLLRSLSAVIRRVRFCHTNWHITYLAMLWQITRHYIKKALLVSTFSFWS